MLISGCNLQGKKDTKKSLEDIRTGTEGVVASFLANAPPEKVYVEQDSDSNFDVVLEIKNKGAYPQPGDVTSLGPEGKVYLSGYDPKIITFEAKESKSNDLSKMTLEGKSTINPNGGQDLITFTGTIPFRSLNVEKYEPTLLATLCYYYETSAGPSVCIDPNPYSTIKEKKVCEVQDISLTNQGAPVAVTKIDEEALARKTQFKITIKNVGGGDVLIKDALKNKCDPNPTGDSKKIVREDVDKVYLKGVKISNRPLKCRPFADGKTEGTEGLIRLINGEGFIICELPDTDYNNKISAYTTPLLIELGYGYRNTAEKKMQIKRESSGLVGRGSGAPPPDATPSMPLSGPISDESEDPISGEHGPFGG